MSGMFARPHAPDGWENARADECVVGAAIDPVTARDQTGRALDDDRHLTNGLAFAQQLITLLHAFVFDDIQFGLQGETGSGFLPRGDNTASFSK